MSISSSHWLDSNGNPAGGNTYGRGFAIGWQNGPLAINGVRHEPNGAFVEDVISAAIDRLEFYQMSKFACTANTIALEHLNSAMSQLHERTRDRQTRGVEGTCQQ